MGTLANSRDARTLTSSETSVLLIEGERLWRGGLKFLLGAHGIHVHGEADSIADVADIAELEQVDVAVVGVPANYDGALDEIWMPTQSTSHTYPNILLLIPDGQRSHAYEAFSAGVYGVLERSADADMLPAAVRLVAAGYMVVSPAVGVEALSAPATPPGLEEFIEQAKSLSRRERQVFSLVVQGLNNREIAKLMFVSESTVKSHIQSLLRKFYLHNRATLIANAYKSGLASGNMLI